MSKKKKPYQEYVMCGDLLVLHGVVNAKTICVHLNKPADCSVACEDEFQSEIFQYANDHKTRYHLCIPKKH